MITKAIDTDAHFWCSNISLLHLQPRHDGTILGDVQAQGGMCYHGAWESPITLPEKGWAPIGISATAQEFADLLAVELGVDATDVVRAIGAALEARLALTDSPMRAEATA